MNTHAQPTPASAWPLVALCGYLLLAALCCASLAWLKDARRELAACEVRAAADAHVADYCIDVVRQCYGLVTSQACALDCPPGAECMCFEAAEVEYRR
jgi:hypothetical protein